MNSAMIDNEMSRSLKLEAAHLHISRLPGEIYSNNRT